MMNVSPFAGKPAEPGMLVNVPRLITAYYTEISDSSVPEQRVSFGTSGHRGSAFENAAPVRARICEGLGSIGFPLNEARNARSNECDFPRTPAGSRSASSARTKN